ncbi:hypothetical protein V6N13_138477 [Hibiscus sabdariffa]
MLSPPKGRMRYLDDGCSFMARSTLSNLGDEMATGVLLCKMIQLQVTDDGGSVGETIAHEHVLNAVPIQVVMPSAVEHEPGQHLSDDKVNHDFADSENVVENVANSENVVDVLMGAASTVGVGDSDKLELAEFDKWLADIAAALVRRGSVGSGQFPSKCSSGGTDTTKPSSLNTKSLLISTLNRTMA